MKLRLVSAALLSLAVAFPVMAGAQAPAAKPTDGPALKLTVVISKANGAKKISSLPFVLMAVLADKSTTANVQMSSQVPIPQEVAAETKAIAFRYQNIGTSITADLAPTESGQFRVTLGISDSQILSDTGPESLKNLPRIQSFTSSTKVLLRDGQTVQYPAATDKISGDVVTIEVTLNVVK